MKNCVAYRSGRCPLFRPKKGREPLCVLLHILCANSIEVCKRQITIVFAEEYCKFQFVVLFSAEGAYLPPGGRWIQNCPTPKAILKTEEEWRHLNCRRKPDTMLKSKHFRPHSSSACGR